MKVAQLTLLEHTPQLEKSCIMRTENFVNKHVHRKPKQCAYWPYLYTLGTATGAKQIFASVVIGQLRDFMHDKACATTHIS